MSLPLVQPSWRAGAVRGPFAASGDPLGIGGRPEKVIDRKTGRKGASDPATTVQGIVVDARILRVPQLADVEAAALDIIVQTFEGQPATSVRRGVRVDPASLADILGVPVAQAAAAKAVLLSRGLLREASGGWGLTSGYRPSVPGTA